VKAIIKRVLQSILFIVITSWVLLAVLLYFYQPKLVFHPHSEIEATPALISLDYEELTLTTSDGIAVNAWWVPHPAARASVLFLHGNAGNISHRLDSIQIFHDLGLSVLIFDYRGYGKSTGTPSEQGTYIDAETAWDYLIEKKKIEQEQIIIFGRSLGGAVASWLAERHLPAGFIMESSFSSIADIGKHYYPYLPTSLLARIKYPSIDRISNIRSPILIIHSKDDEIIPYSHSERLFTEAIKEKTAQKTLLEINGGHNEGFILSGKKYSDGLDKFISDIVKP
jgi:fermentation-respiration switch protein FrsA (DUF1100 family)